MRNSMTMAMVKMSSLKWAAGAAVTVSASLLAPRLAMASGEECTSDADCTGGDACLATPCAAPTCEADDPACEPMECKSYCGPTGGGDVPVGNSCETNADCGTGFSCEVIGSMGTGCACPDGAEDCGCPEPTEPVEMKGCVPAPCATDADCGDGYECASIEVPCATTAIACEEGQACPEPEPCEAETKTQCQPKWAGTCETAADCGEGFECKALEQCSCSGGGSTGSGGGVPPEPTDPAEPQDAGASEEEGDASGAPVPPDDECVCEPTDEKYCAPLQVTCVQDSDCPSSWTCAFWDSGTTSNGGSATDTACSPDGECPEPTEEPAEEPASGDAMVAPQGQCVPPNYTDWANTGALPEAVQEEFGGPATGEPKDDTNGGDGGGDVAGDDGGATAGPSDSGSTGSSSGGSAGCTTVGATGSAAFPGLIGLFAGLALMMRRRGQAKG
ncbi:MAG: hypothetical protein IV100_14245 [Myxococcales bacterium]|nr:hypothetical protein [Myxococcales bacterium]